MTKTPGLPVRGSTTGRPIMVLFDILGQRWTLRILWELREERLTFRELQNRCENMSPTILNGRLKQLRDSGFVDHEEGGYGHTDIGRELTDHLVVFDGWAKNWAEKIGMEYEAPQ